MKKKEGNASLGQQILDLRKKKTNKPRSVYLLGIKEKIFVSHLTKIYRRHIQYPTVLKCLAQSNLLSI